ncbi:MAG TPA: hypothetical protein VK154_08230 [Chitinophagales bacterium]|nr:hypothetical protein [Chitinophagales bacterium]
MKKLLKNTLTGLCITIITLLLMLAVLEVAYRYQWVDFYASELRQLNRHEDLNSTKKKILVFGDSFSAQQGSYVAQLKYAPLNNHCVINSSVAGISAREINLFAQSRIDEFKPDKIVIQLYTGNDLVDISHPYNWDSISVVRNLYWKTSDLCWSLAWLNYKLATLRQVFDTEQSFKYPRVTDTFSVNGYAGRVKMLLRADRQFIEKSVLLKDEKYHTAFNRMVDYVQSISNYFYSTNPNGKVVVLVIPHCTEVKEEYRSNYDMLGAVFTQPCGTVYPFYTLLQQRIKGPTIVDCSVPLHKAQSMGIQTYYYSDEHLTHDGQKVVYKTILSHLQ